MNNPYRDAMTNQEYKAVLVRSINEINDRIAFIGTLCYNNESVRTERLKILFNRQDELLDRLKDV